VRESEKIIIVSGAVPGSNGSFGGAPCRTPKKNRPNKIMTRESFRPRQGAKEAKIGIARRRAWGAAVHDVVGRDAGRRGVPVRRNSKTKADWGMYAGRTNRGGQKGKGRGERDINHRSYGAAVVWSGDQSRAILPKKVSKIGCAPCVPDGAERADSTQGRATC